MSSNIANNFEKLNEFRKILSAFTKKILHDHPKDIIDFSVQYFKFLENGQKITEFIYDDKLDEFQNHKKIESLKTIADEKDIEKKEEKKLQENKALFHRSKNNDEEEFLVNNDGVLFSEKESVKDENSESFIQFFDNKINLQSTKEIERQLQERKNTHEKTKINNVPEEKKDLYNMDDFFLADIDGQF